MMPATARIDSPDLSRTLIGLGLVPSPPKKDEGMSQPTDQSIFRDCTSCRETFEITPDEQRFLSDLAEQQGRSWSLPRRCVLCRKERRAQQFAVQSDMPTNASFTLTCVDCSNTFHFGSRDIAFYQERGWQWPRRCRFCRETHRAARPQRRI